MICHICGNEVPEVQEVTRSIEIGDNAGTTVEYNICYECSDLMFDEIMASFMEEPIIHRQQRLIIRNIVKGVGLRCTTYEDTNKW